MRNFNNADISEYKKNLYKSINSFDPYNDTPEQKAEVHERLNNYVYPIFEEWGYYITPIHSKEDKCYVYILIKSKYNSKGVVATIWKAEVFNMISMKDDAEEIVKYIIHCWGFILNENNS